MLSIDVTLRKRNRLFFSKEKEKKTALSNEIDCLYLLLIEMVSKEPFIPRRNVYFK